MDRPVESLKQSLVNALPRAATAAERLMRRSRAGVPPEDARSVLVLEYLLPLGCCVHLTPLYEAIRASRPHATITVATRGIGCALLRHNPAIDHVVETPDPLLHLVSSARRLARELSRLGIEADCALTGVADQRTKIGLLAAFSCRGWRGGFSQAPALYRYPLRVDRSLSHIANNLRLAAILGCDSSHREPRVYFSQADLLSARALADHANPSRQPLVIMVTQTSGGQRTGWHRERFVTVIQHVHATLGCAIIYVGTACESDAIEAIRERAGGIGTSLAGRTSPTQLAALLAMSDYAVSLDTGTMHVGRAVGLPMVVLGPSWQKPIEWMPLSVPNIHILRGQDRSSIPDGYQLDEIEAGDVIASFTKLLAEHPPTEQAREERVRRSLSSVDHLAR